MYSAEPRSAGSASMIRARIRTTDTQRVAERRAL